MSGVIYGSFQKVIFTRAVDFLKRRKVLTKEEYMKLDEEARAKSFMVSGYTSLTVLQEFSDQLAKAVEEGRTKEEFQKDMDSFLTSGGYHPLNPWRSDVIFRTNVQTAYNAGHYRSMTSTETLRLRPYWQYKTAADGKVRDSHAAMHNLVFRADDPVWDIWYPPNGFRCRCTVISKSRAQVEREGLQVQTKVPRAVDHETGEILEGMETPDKGFVMNPAKSVYKPDMTHISRPLREIYRRRMDGNK